MDTEHGGKIMHKNEQSSMSEAEVDLIVAERDLFRNTLRDIRELALRHVINDVEVELRTEPQRQLTSKVMRRLLVQCRDDHEPFADVLLFLLNEVDQLKVYVKATEQAQALALAESVKFWSQSYPSTGPWTSNTAAK